jgi:hypothetical protein
VFILNVVEVLCFDALLQVFILKVLGEPSVFMRGGVTGEIQQSENNRGQRR